MIWQGFLFGIGFVSASIVFAIVIMILFLGGMYLLDKYAKADISTWFR